MNTKTILTDSQIERTKESIENFKKALREERKRKNKIDKLAFELYEHSLISMINTLKAQIKYTKKNRK